MNKPEDKHIMISVIIPAYNRAHLIQRVILNIVNQTRMDKFRLEFTLTLILILGNKI